MELPGWLIMTIISGRSRSSPIVGIKTGTVVTHANVRICAIVGTSIVLIVALLRINVRIKP